MSCIANLRTSVKTLSAALFCQSSIASKMSSAPQLPSKMRAVILSRTGEDTQPTLSFSSEQPVPTPAAGEVLVKVHASAIQPSDVYNSRGGFHHTTYPRIPGRDFSGTVVAGDEAWIGHEVFGTSGSTHGFSVDGFHAEYTVVPVAGLSRKPSSLTHLQAATIGVPYTTAALTVRRSGAISGETALVLGANGSVGRAACLVLERQGCRVLRAARGPTSSTAADVDTAADPSLSAVRSLTAGKGVDVVIDTIGMPDLTRSAVDNALASGGRLVFIAAPKTADVDLAFNMKDFYRQEKSLIGANSVAYSIDKMATLLNDLQEQFGADEWNKASSGRWETVSLEDAVAMYQVNEKGRKFVISML